MAGDSKKPNKSRYIILEVILRVLTGLTVISGIAWRLFAFKIFDSSWELVSLEWSVLFIFNATSSNAIYPTCSPESPSVGLQVLIDTCSPQVRPSLVLLWLFAAYEFIFAMGLLGYVAFMLRRTEYPLLKHLSIASLVWDIGAMGIFIAIVTLVCQATQNVRLKDSFRYFDIGDSHFTSGFYAWVVISAFLVAISLTRSIISIHTK